jgi:hypothetical protein
MTEINDILKKYQANEIKSDSDFAEVLKNFYPKYGKTGILVFFYNSDSLRRFFFEPGKIIDQKTDQADDRMPKKRGIELPVPPVTYGMTYDSLIRLTTDRLIPEKFTDKYQHLLICTCTIPDESLYLSFTGKKIIHAIRTFKKSYA